MIEQARGIKAYDASHGVLIIEHIVQNKREKCDIIREILAHMAFPDGLDRVRPADRNTADDGLAVEETGT